MSCSSCNKNNFIVNKHFNLCIDCNRARLNELKHKKGVSIRVNKKKCLKTDKNSIKNYNFVKNLVSKKTTSNKIEEDEIFYEKCFNNSDHKCEECGTLLPDTFRDSNNKIIARWRYSHIIPKSIAPELRHNLKNINHLCLKDHKKWENGDKESMNIFLKNKKILPNYF